MGVTEQFFDVTDQLRVLQVIFQQNDDNNRDVKLCQNTVSGLHRIITVVFDHYAL